MVASLSDSGVREAATIDGTNISVLPEVLESQPEFVHSFFATAAGKPIHFQLARQGYPNVTEIGFFPFNYDTLTATDKTFFEKLIRSGTVHTLALWKPEAFTWTAYQGQTFFYLPRRIAPSVLGRSTTTYEFEVTINGTAVDSTDIIYKTAVSESDTVPAGEVWIENDGINMKMGTGLVKDDEVVVTYYPLYDVVVERIAMTIPAIQEERKLIALREVLTEA